MQNALSFLLSVLRIFQPVVYNINISQKGLKFSRINRLGFYAFTLNFLVFISSNPNKTREEILFHYNYRNQNETRQIVLPFTMQFFLDYFGHNKLNTISRNSQNVSVSTSESSGKACRLGLLPAKETRKKGFVKSPDITSKGTLTDVEHQYSPLPGTKRTSSHSML